MALPPAIRRTHLPRGVVRWGLLSEWTSCRGTPGKAMSNGDNAFNLSKLAIRNTTSSSPRTAWPSSAHSASWCPDGLAPPLG